MTGFEWTDLVGIVGVAAIIVAYLALQLGKLDGRSPVYSGANAIGATLVLVSLWFDFNLSAFVVEIFWVVISVIGLGRSFRERRVGRRSTGTIEADGPDK